MKASHGCITVWGVSCLIFLPFPSSYRHICRWNEVFLCLILLLLLFYLSLVLCLIAISFISNLLGICFPKKLKQRITKPFWGFMAHDILFWALRCWHPILKASSQAKHFLLKRWIIFTFALQFQELWSPGSAVSTIRLEARSHRFLPMFCYWSSLDLGDPSCLFCTLVFPYIK